MSNTVRIPLDMEGLAEFRRTSGRLGDAEARALALVLWLGLGFSARSHERPGFLPDDDARVFLGPRLGDCERDGWIKAVDGGYLCQHFARANDGEGPESKGQYAARMSRVGPTGRRLQRDNSQLTMLIPDASQRDEHGHEIATVDLQRATLLIRTLDAMLGAPSRSPNQFSPGIMACAVGVVRSLDAGNVELELRRIARHQKGPILNGLSPENVLARWRDLLASLPLTS